MRSSESYLANASPMPSRSPASSCSSRLTLATPADTSSFSVIGLLRPSLDGLGDRTPHEHLLPGDAAEVGGGVAVPVAVLVLVLEVARAHELPGLLAVEHRRTPACGTSRPVWRSRTGASNQSGTPPTASTSFSNPDEVDLDVVVDRDVEVVLDRVDQRLRAVGVRGVDAGGVAGAGDREVEVAWEGEEVGLLLLRVDAQHHDRVGALAAGVAEEAAGVGVVRVEPSRLSVPTRR